MKEFSVDLCPQSKSSLHSGNDLATFRSVVNEIRREWPVLCQDDVEISRLMYPKRLDEEILVSDTPDGLFQVFVWLQHLNTDDVGISLRFAYSNPRTVYEPFCSLVEWLMKHYDLCCYISADLAPEQQGIGDTICEADNLRSILVPSMEYNRWLWQGDVQTEEEAILRPGDAVARFMTPLYINNPQASSV